MRSGSLLADSTAVARTFSSASAVSRNRAVIMSGGGSGTSALAAIIRSGTGEPGSTCFLRVEESSSMAVITLVDDAQPFQGEELVHLLDAARLASDEARKAAGGDHPDREAQLPAHALADPVHHAHVAEDQPGLHRVHGVLPQHRGRTGELDPRQLGGVLEQRLHGDGDPRADAPAEVLALRVDGVEGGRGPEVHDDEPAPVLSLIHISEPTR